MLLDVLRLQYTMGSGTTIFAVCFQSVSWLHCLIEEQGISKIFVLSAYYLVYLSEFLYSIYFQDELHYYAFVTKVLLA